MFGHKNEQRKNGTMQYYYVLCIATKSYIPFMRVEYVNFQIPSEN